MSIPSDEIVVINKVRYTRRDAEREGLIENGKVITRQTNRRGNGGRAKKKAETPVQPESVKTEEDQDSTGHEAPEESESKAKWLAFATDQGFQPEELEGLGKDGIIALVKGDPEQS